MGQPSVGAAGAPFDKALVSYCTSGAWFGGFSLVEAPAEVFDESGVAGGGRVVEPLVLVVGFLGFQQAGVVPCLDGAGVNAELFGDLVGREQAARLESFGVAWEVVGAAEVEHYRGGEWLAGAGAAGGGGELGGRLGGGGAVQGAGGGGPL